MSQDRKCVYILKEMHRLEEKEKCFFRRSTFCLRKLFFDFQNQSDGGRHGEKEIESNIVCSVENTFMQFIALLIPTELAMSGCDFCQSEMI